MPTDLPLKDIHLPADISWWPPALGWWLLFALTVTIIIIAIIITKKLLKPTLKKQATKALNSIEAQFQSTGDPTQCIRDISSFLRRVVLSQTSSSYTAGLTGKAWLTMLDKPLDTPEFSEGIGITLLNSPYQRQANHDDATQLINLCRKWIKRL